MNYSKIQKDFKTMTDDTQKLVNKYNQTVQSIRSQELAIDKVKQKLSELKEYQSLGLLKDNEGVKIEQLTKQLELMEDKLQDTKEKASELGNEVKDSMNDDSTNLFGSTMDKVGDKITKLKNRITGLILSAAVFNVLSKGLNALRDNFISLLKTDDNFNASLNQIKANLMTAFAPIYNACLPAINALMNSLSKITGTIAVFIANLFGTSIQDATKDAKKLSGALNKTASSAKKASGALASFDTLEVLQDTTDNVGNIGAGASGETIDYSGEIKYSQKLLDFMNKVKDVIVEIWEWGTKNKELVIGIAALIGTAFVVSKIVNFVSSFSPLANILKLISGLFIKVGEDGTRSFNKVGTGATIAIAGFILMIKNISDLIMNWDELDTKQKLIKIGMAALGAAAIALGIAIATGFSVATLGIGALIALIVTAVTAVIGFIAKLAGEKDAIMDTKDAQDKYNQAKQDTIDANNNYISSIDKAEEAMRKLQEAQDKTGISGEELYKSVQNGTLDYANMTAEQREVYKAYMDNKSAQDEVNEATKALSDEKKAETMASFDNQLAIAAESDNYDEYKKSVVEAYNEGKISADEARDLIEKSMSRMSDASQATFMEDLPNDIKEGMDPDRYQTTLQKFKNWFGTGVGKIGEMFTTLFTKTIPEKLEKLGNTIHNFFTRTVPNVVIGAIESLINSLIWGIEGAMNRPVKAINKIIRTANLIPGVNISALPEVYIDRIRLPRLATGAVIPPRQEFAAILGDQKHGTNIEAPLETIKQANREVMQEFLGAISGLQTGEKEIVFKNLSFVLQFGKKEFNKLVIDAIRISERELGKQLLLN